MVLFCVGISARDTSTQGQPTKGHPHIACFVLIETGSYSGVHTAWSSLCSLGWPQTLGSSASTSQVLSLQACALSSFLWLVLLRCFCLAEASSSVLCSGNPLTFDYYSSKGEAQSQSGASFTCHLQHLLGQFSEMHILTNSNSEANFQAPSQIH